MQTLINIGIVLATFFGMEGVAWLTHKYVMHGLFWFLHEDHHQKDPNDFLEKNDFFFLIFAIPGIICLALGSFYVISWSMIFLSISVLKYLEIRITGI